METLPSNDVKNCIISRFSDEPLFFEVALGRRIESAFGEGIASQDAPHPAQDAGNDAEVIDAPLGVLRAGRRVEARPAGEMFLIETDHADAQSLKIGSEHLLFQKEGKIARIPRQKVFRREDGQVFLF